MTEEEFTEEIINYTTIVVRNEEIVRTDEIVPMLNEYLRLKNNHEADGILIDSQRWKIKGLEYTVKLLREKLGTVNETKVKKEKKPNIDTLLRALDETGRGWNSERGTLGLPMHSKAAKQHMRQIVFCWLYGEE